MSVIAVLKKTFKCLLYLMLLLTLFLILFLSYVLHTESGSRFVIKQGLDFVGMDLKYDNISGNLSHGLIIKNMRYKDQSIDIKVENISYRSNWSWLSRHVELSDFIIDDVIIETKSGSESNTESQPFSGIELPLSIDIKELLVNRLTVNTDFSSKNNMNEINAIVFSALVEKQNTTIKQLSIESLEHSITTTGTIDYSKGMAFELETDWQINLESQKLQASGSISGNLNTVNLEQKLNVQSTQLQGDYLLFADVKGLQTEPEFNFLLTAPDSKLLLDNNDLKFKDLQVEFNGVIDDYQISVQSALNQDKLTAVNLPDTQIKLQASGNSQQLTTEVLEIITPEGSIDLQTKVEWQDQLIIESQINLNNFNPQQLLQDWPGLINGQINLSFKNTEKGLFITTENNSLKGQLKGQPLSITGAANYSDATLFAEQFQIELGENNILFNGQVTAQKVALEAAVNWTDLSVLDPKLGGDITGFVELTGDPLNPQVKVNLIGQQLVFAEYEVSELILKSEGQWNQQLNTHAEAKDVLLSGQKFNTIQIHQSGWLDGHEIQVAVVHKDINTVLEIEGQYDNQITKNNPLWQGQLLNHELIVDTDKKIQLQAPVAVEIGNQISVGEGCWQGVEAGTLCMAINDIKQAQGKYQGSLTVDAFSLLPLQFLLPQNIELKGKLQGKAEFLYQTDNVMLESSIKIQEGELLILNAKDNTQRTSVETFDVKVKTSNKNIAVAINTELEDSSFLNLRSNFENPNDQGWLVNSTVEGVFFSTDVISELSEEINELEGQVLIDGTIIGAITAPKVNLNLSQPDGHLILTRLGTAIEKLKLSINTEDINQPQYNIKFSGINLAAINQGEIETTGVLSFSRDKQWQYQGNISGHNFMLLNLPEVKFNISPKLIVLANEDAIDINGDLVIDSGHVTVEELPPNSISNSDDLIIHTSEPQSSTDYLVTMDILTTIGKPVILDVIGLNTGLTGAIRLKQSKEQGLAGKGTLNLVDGSYEIYGQKLDITKGELTFTGPLNNPSLNINTSRESISGDVLAGVQLGGTVNNLQSELYSEPSLSDIEKLSYIMTGRGIDSSGNDLDGESLKQAAIVMGLNQSSPVFNQIQNQFGIDVLTLRESAVAADTVVEAGKKINDKLYVSYNQGLFNRLGFWMLKYQVNQFLNLETTQGDDQSIDLVYTRKAEK